MHNEEGRFMATVAVMVAASSLITESDHAVFAASAVVASTAILTKPVLQLPAWVFTVFFAIYYHWTEPNLALATIALASGFL